MFIKPLFLFCFVATFYYSYGFDWDVCKYGKDSSILYSIYTDEEIAFHCSLHAKEMIMLKHPVVVKQNIEINNIKEPPRRLRRSVGFFDSNSIKEQIDYCSSINYLTNDCGINIRKEILNQISNMTINLDSNAQLQLISNLLYFYDFSLYFTAKQQLETLDFLKVISNINWGIKIKETYLFQDILWRIINIMNNFILHENNLDNVNKILVTHETIFSNILQWKLLKLNFIFQLFFNPLSKAQLFKRNEEMQNRIGNFIIEMSNIILNNIYFKHEIDMFKLYSYAFFVKNLNYTQQQKYNGIYTVVTEKDIFNKSDSMKIGNIHIKILYQDKINITGVREELVQVYNKFTRIFHNLIDTSNKRNSTILFRIFTNKDEYTKYGPLLNYATNNGGITYSNSLHPNIYCYGIGNVVLNLGHEFVHGLTYLFFKNSAQYLPIIHEGLAEAIGQRPDNIPVGLIEKVYKLKPVITYEDIKSSSYDKDLSPYGFGFIIFSTLFNNGYTKDLVHSLNTFGENHEFRNLIEENLEDFKKFTDEYIRQYYLELRLRQYRARVNSLPRFKETYQAYFPGNIVIVIDNTYFYLYKDKIILHQPTYPLGSDKDILNDERNEVDFKYLISFGIMTSIKQIPDYQILYPEIIKKKETIELYKDDRIISNKKIREKIFNALFNIGNELGINTIQTGKTFYETKDYIKSKVDFDDTQYYKLSIPTWNTTSDIQKAIYSINTEININMTFLRSIDSYRLIDTEDRIISEIFSQFFPKDYFEDDRIVEIIRSTGKNYLKQNVALVKQFTVQINKALNKNTEVVTKETALKDLLRSFKNEIFEEIKDTKEEIRMLLSNNLMYYNNSYSNLRMDLLNANKYEKQILNEIFLEIKKFTSFDSSFGAYDDTIENIETEKRFRQLELLLNETLSKQESINKSVQYWNNIVTFFSENVNVFMIIIFLSLIILSYYLIYRIVKKYNIKRYNSVSTKA